jgi:uncharacterized protein YbjQ (UPF0145 family)
MEYQFSSLDFSSFLTKKRMTSNKSKVLKIKTNKKMADIIITTGSDIPGKKIIKVLGIVKGNTVRTRNVGRDIGASLRSMIGGEVKTYTQMSIDAREEAYNRMVNEALNMGADAIIGVRFSTSMIMTGASEMLAYGTAVKIGE